MPDSASNEKERSHEEDRAFQSQRRLVKGPSDGGRRRRRDHTPPQASGCADRLQIGERLVRLSAPERPSIPRPRGNSPQEPAYGPRSQAGRRASVELSRYLDVATPTSREASRP